MYYGVCNLTVLRYIKYTTSNILNPIYNIQYTIYYILHITYYILHITYYVLRKFYCSVYSAAPIAGGADRKTPKISYGTTAL